MNAFIMRDVDFVNGLLPSHIRTEWNPKYHDTSQSTKETVTALNTAGDR